MPQLVITPNKERFSGGLTAMQGLHARINAGGSETGSTSPYGSFSMAVMNLAGSTAAVGEGAAKPGQMTLSQIARLPLLAL